MASPMHKLFAMIDRIRAAAGALGERFFQLPERKRRRLLAFSVLGVVLLNYSLYATCGWRGCPDAERLNAYQPGGASVLVDRNGREFGDLAPVDRRMVQLSDLPDHLPAAFIAVEDRRFFRHRGVDWRRVGGAFVRNIFAGGITQGSSTITMQLARNIFNDRLRADDRSLRRKLFEARVAKRIERKFSKQEILELYLNHIYFGNGAYGVESAARQYFGKSAAAVDLDEAALLAALPKAPTHYDPRERPARARTRRNLVLSLMAEQDVISEDAAERARNRRLGVTREAPSLRQREANTGYFIQLVRRQLEQEFGEDLYRKRLRIFTTLDINAQRAAERALRNTLDRIDGDKSLQGSIVIMETLTGDVLAMVGGRDYRASSYNRAILARRQAGSAFKPFVFAAALADGMPPSQPILDAPYTFVSDGKEWQPGNFDGRYRGRITMREALVESRNVASVRLANSVGPDAVAEMAHDAGVEAEIRNTPMVALGITEVTPLELVNAYGSFAGMGTRAEPRYVQRVENEDGDVVFETRVERDKVLDPAIAFVMTDMLADVVDYGTGTGVRDAGFRGPAAGKTGTTNDATDVWFVGYSPDLVAGVWIGYDEQKRLPGDASGGSLAAPLWGRMMREVYTTRPMPQGWIIPGDIETRLVDPESGRVLAKGCRPRSGSPREEVFLDGQKIDEICPAGERDRGFFGAIGGFFASLFKSDNRGEPADLEKPDRDLGTVRLASRRERVREDDGGSDEKPRKKKKGKGKRGKDSDGDSD